MLKGLIFDLDGVLTDSARFHLVAWNDLAKQMGINLTKAQLNSLRGLSRMDSLNLILKYGHQENKYSKEQKKKFTDKKNRQFLKEVATMTPKDVFPGIPELLQEAKEQKLKMVIASSSKNAPTILKKLDIFNKFDGIVNPAELHHGKPDPEIYQKAQALLGFKKDEVISFEDAAAGVAAIKAAGQFAVGIGNAQTLKGADYIVPTTADLNLAKIEAAFAKRKK